MLLEQALFGYDDGHRLLASSSASTADAAKDALPLSDLVPGALLDADAPYWTGVPLRSHKTYVVMCTWAAPEMPRPGCVWTHAFFIRNADLAALGDLRQLKKAFRRPVRGDFIDYARPVAFEQIPQLLPDATINSALAAHCLQSLYAEDRPQPVSAYPGELDDLAFLIWNQQWPRLKRSFSFRTTVTRSDLRADTFKIDFHANSLPHPGRPPPQEAEWLQVAVDDLPKSGSTTFRNFLTRYGADLRKGRSQFRLLAEVFAKTRGEAITEYDLNDLLDLLSAQLPDLNEGGRLKRELLTGDGYLLPVLHPLDAIRTSLGRGTFLFREMEDALTAGVISGWQEHRSAIISLAEEASEQPSAVGEKLIQTVSELLSADDIFEVTRNYPRLRKTLVAANPELLISEKLVELPPHEIADLIEGATLSKAVKFRVLDQCAVNDDYWLANRLHAIFGDELIEAIFRKVVEQGASSTGAAFRSLVRSNLEKIISLDLLADIETYTHAWRAAHLLGWDSYGVLQLGAAPWVAALEHARDDIGDWERTELYAFLFVVAYESPSHSSEALFETTFPELFHRAARRDMTALTEDTLRRHLPWLGFNGGALERRLCSAVARAYLTGRLEAVSFHGLLVDPVSMGALISEVEERFGGSRFLREVAKTGYSAARKTTKKSPKAKKGKSSRSD